MTPAAAALRIRLKSMAETNGSGGYINERMDRVEAMFNMVAADHVFFQEHHKSFLEQHKYFQEQHQNFLQEHQLLLRAQVVMEDTLQKLAESQRETAEKLNALIATVDGSSGIPGRVSLTFSPAI